MTTNNPYDEHYYQSSLGPIPYDRSHPEWLQFFGRVADGLIRNFQPRRVLDVGCAKGFLVESLWDRGVEALGFDISEAAISQVRADMKPFCRTGSVTDPIESRYDLVTCIEILEHVTEQEAAIAIANITACTDVVVFSSTPSDLDEPTHKNVRPVRSWISLFANAGFGPDVAADASFIAPHAMVFRRTEGVVPEGLLHLYARLILRTIEDHRLAKEREQVNADHQRLRREGEESRQRALETAQSLIQGLTVVRAQREALERDLAQRREAVGTLAGGGSAFPEPDSDGPRLRKALDALETGLRGLTRGSTTGLAPDHPRFSVVAAVFNKADSLPSFFRAFLAQTYPGPIELVLVDDASTDASVAVIEEWRSRSASRDGFDVVFIRHPENRGNCASRNEGLAAARGELIAVMDADNIVNRRFAEEHVRAHADGHFQIVVGPHNVESGSRPIDSLMAAFEERPEDVLAEMSLQDPQRLDSFLNCITRNFSIKRAFLNGPLFDEAFSYRLDPGAGFGWEDVEMGYQLYLRGLRVRFTRDAWAVHLSHLSAVPEAEKPVRSIRNFRKLHEKHPSLQHVVPTWTRETFGKIAEWLESQGQGDNADAHALRANLGGGPRRELAPLVKTGRRLRVLTYRWHCGHQSELWKLPFDFVLAKGLTALTGTWDYGTRALPSSAHFIQLEKIRLSDYDLCILHFDEFCLRPELSNGILTSDWGSLFQHLLREFPGPKVAVCHGVPLFKGEFDAHYDKPDLFEPIDAARQAIVELLGDTPVVCNSHQALAEWGFRNARAIWHGFDPIDYPPTLRERGILCAVAGHMRARPQYRGLPLFEEVTDDAPFAVDFLGDDLPRRVAPDPVDPSAFTDPNEFARVNFNRYVTLLRSYRVLFNPTRSSPMPRTRAEAMMCGLATVNAANHDVDLFIKNGVNGFYSNSASELRSQLDFLSRRPAEAERMGAAGRRTALDVFHIDRYLDDWQQTVSDVLANRRLASGPAPVVRAPRKTKGGVLYLSGADGDTQRYRCDHVLEYLHRAGISGRKLAFNDPQVLSCLPDLVTEHDLFVLHRVPMCAPVEALLRQIAEAGKTALFETDDLVFDDAYPKFFERIGLVAQLGPDDVARYRATLERCTGAVCSTHFLQTRLTQFGKEAHVVRNGFSQEMRAISRNAIAVGRKHAADNVVIGYPSGTSTHRWDFAVAAPALLRVLERFPAVELWIVGHLDVDPRFERFGDRVRRVPFTSWRRLPFVLKEFDINIAPLEIEEPFCQAKSELKWLEAALVETPTVASPVEAYRFAIRHGETGYLATSEEDWQSILERLVCDAAERERVGAAALREVEDRYSPERRSQEVKDLFTALREGTWPSPAGRP